MAVLCYVPDLLMRSKIDNAARHYGVEAHFVGDGAAFEAALDQASGVRLVCIDLDAPGADGPALVRSAREKADARIVGFCSHVLTDLIRESRQAGASTVMPNSNFSASIPGLIAEAAEASSQS